LASKFGGNVHEHGVVTINANRMNSDNPGHAAKNAANLWTDSYFCSANAPNQSISLDFRNLMIATTHYLLCTYSFGPNYNHLKS
jgi:hypothetical protein